MTEAGHHIGPSPMDAGGSVRRIRKDMGLTQIQFAERLGVASITVHRWESGQSRPRRLALARLRELAGELAEQDTPAELPATPAAAATPPLDFAGNPEGVSAVAEALRLAYGHQFNPAFGSETARIDPLPHQRIAVYERMLGQDPLRFLLADDAGAGKTIMTGLYIREMLLRGGIRRVLIVPPAGLVGNWERELRTLFRLQFRIVSGTDARAGNPFRGSASDLVIVSVNTLIGERMFEALRDTDVPPYDLAVFDEAHKLSATVESGRINKTQRYELAEALAGCVAPASHFDGLGWAVRHLLLLTATPHMGRDSPYHFLWRLLDPQVFATGEAFRRFPRPARERYFLRRTKEEMVGLDGRPLYPHRECSTFSYDLSPGPEGEQALYDATTAYLLHAYGRALDNRPAVRLAMGVFQRRLASSTHALLRSFERRIGKIEQSIDDLRSGRTSAAELRRRQHGLDRAHRNDFFDIHSADEDALEDGTGERNEDYEDAVLGAVVAVTIDELSREIETLRGLHARARRLLDSGRESKFEKLREALEDPRYAGEKWLVFSEHRDTVDYLIRRLEGLGFSGQVAQIHGGMAWPEREEQVEFFRRPGGARYLVATDAAGEGINLQFCRLMVSYDIPWNPARIEQRMGRIHRYGQRHDVRMVNLVAGSTHEGRVLQVLLEKLDAIRNELRSDKVFDMIGRLFENVSLREYMIEALTDEGERRVLDRLESGLTGDRVRHIEEGDERAYGRGEGRSGEVAERLGGLRRDLDRERYLQLLPGYVRRFVEKSAGLLDLEIRGDLDGFFSFTPRRSGALDELLPALEGYPPVERERLRVHRPGSDAEANAPCVWLHPGEPVFDALSERILRTHARDALRGSIFIDPRAVTPYLFHLAQVTVEREFGEPTAVPAPELLGAAEPAGMSDTAKVWNAKKASAATDDAAPAPRRREIVERRLLGLRQGGGDGAPVECPVEHVLLLRGTPGVAPGAVALASRALGMRAEAARYAERHVLERLVGEHRDALRAELPERRRRVGIGFDLRAADLAGRRAKLARTGAGYKGEQNGLDEVKREQRALAADKERALARIETAPDRIVSGEVRFIAHVLVVPANDAGEQERYDASVEEIAVRIALGWEKERATAVQDVSKPERARLAGLPDWPGFDLLATHPDGEVRSIEVKGRAGQGTIQMEANEWKQACHLGELYWLYVVFDCATSAPRLVRVRDPFAKLLANRRDASAYNISARSLLEAAEETEPCVYAAPHDG